MIKAGAALFSAASLDEADAIADCKAYAANNCLTKDDVKIIKLHGSVLVIAKRDFYGSAGN